MADSRKSRGFRLEIRIGIGIIILVLTVLNIASYYTLYRMERFIESGIRERLTEASLKTAGEISRSADFDLPVKSRDDLVFEYDLEKLRFFPLYPERVITISQSGLADSSLMAFDSSLTGLNISRVLRNIPVFYHDHGRSKYLLLFPAESSGSKYLIASLSSTDMLSAVENAMRVLLIFALIIGAVILMVVVRLIRNVIRPYGKLAEEVKRHSLDRKVDPDDINSVIEAYEDMIAELKDKEADLRRMNEIVTSRADRLEVYNNHILRSIDTGIITIGRNHQVSTINKAASELLGLDLYNALEQDYRSVLEEFPGILSAIDESFERNQSIHYRDLKLKVNDRQLRLLLSVSSLKDTNDENIGLVILLNDQTEFAAMQAALENSRRMAVIGEMSGGLAHQLRNSIMAIIGFARLVEKKVSADDSLGQTASSLIKESRQAEELVARFLDFAKPLHLNEEEMELESFVKEIKEAAESRYPHISVTVEHTDETIESFFADPLLLKQAIGNIIDNACRAYDGKTGEVRFSVKKSFENIAFKISDDAGGIPNDYHERIFTPFFSGSPSGSGLGLPLAEKIVARHSGNISFESEINRGTVFKIILPLKDRTAGISSAEQQPIRQ